MNIDVDRAQAESAATRIAGRRSQILDLWRALARARPAAAGLGRLELDDSMPVFLDKLAEYLATPEPDEREALDVPPVLHAHERLRADFSLRETLDEYALLRLAILRVAPEMSGAAAARVHATIDRAMATCATVFADERAALARRRRNQLVALFVHDLKSPALVIGLLAERIAARAGAAAKPVDRLLAQLRGEVATLGRMINDVLLAGRADPGETAACERSAVGVRAVVEEIAKHLAPLAPGEAIENGVPEDLQVETEPTLLMHLLQNLLANAVLHGEAGAVRVLGAAAAEGGATVEVRDRGPGLEPAIAARFARAAEQAFGTEVDEPAAGPTLGLTAAARVAALLGGCLEHERQDGETVFRVRLPAKQPQQRSGA